MKVQIGSAKVRKKKEKLRRSTLEITVITRGVSVWPLEGKNRVALHDSRRGPSFSVDHGAINERETVRSDDYYNIGGLK